MTLDQLIAAFNRSHGVCIRQARDRFDIQHQEVAEETCFNDSEAILVAPENCADTLKQFKIFIESLNFENPDPIEAFLLRKQSAVPAALDSIQSSLRLLGLSGLKDEPVHEIMSLFKKATKVIWHGSDNGCLILLLEDELSLAENLRALGESLINDIGTPLALALSPASNQLSELPLLWDLTQQLLSFPSQGDVLRTLDQQIVSIAAAYLRSAKPMPSLTPFLPLEDLLMQMDEELLKTAEQFFRHNLNISDTAKAMFLHRNTLLYRLDKIQRVSGFDLRCFEDSWYFKLLTTILNQEIEGPREV